MQDTFLSVWRKLDTFKGDSQFGSWLYRVAANAALMRLRAQRRHPEVSTEELPIDYLDNYGHLPAAGENWAKRPDDELQSDELRRRIQAAVDELPEIYRTVFLVRDVEGLSTEETAEVLRSRSRRSRPGSTARGSRSATPSRATSSRSKEPQKRAVSRL